MPGGGREKEGRFRARAPSLLKPRRIPDHQKIAGKTLRKLRPQPSAKQMQMSFELQGELQ